MKADWLHSVFGVGTSQELLSLIIVAVVVLARLA
jgi:hypothetical protein